MTESAFSKDFASARQRFLAAASAAGAQLDSYRYPATGPAGEDLSTDVAWIGPVEAAKVFVTVSGTHGVEGFCGSGAQIDWLERKEQQRLPVDTAAMLVHAINPYGFAWRRRVTHENVDLNRNWIDFTKALPENAEYDKLAESLCPAEWTDESRGRTMQQLLAYIAAHDLRAFVQAVSGGQYQHDKGLFFGGTRPTASRQTLTTILTERLGNAGHVGIIDYHSGLGPSGFGDLMVTAGVDSDMYARARSWYGMSVTLVGTKESASAGLSGEWAAALPQLLPRATVTAVALEFGTVDQFQVLEALRADNWLHAYADPQTPQAELIRTLVTNTFYVDTDLWRGMVLGQSLLACRQAIAGLSA